MILSIWNKESKHGTWERIVESGLTCVGRSDARPRDATCIDTGAGKDKGEDED